jgi:hypothetical protein
MPAISLKAHYDGTSIQLDEPYVLPPDAQLLVTVLPSEGEDSDLFGWRQLSAESLARAYGEHEPEYTEQDLLQ